MSGVAILALALVVGGGIYIRLRWRRSPQAYRAMIALAVGYFVAGSILGALILHLGTPKPTEVATSGADANGLISELERAEGLKAFCAAQLEDRDSTSANHNIGRDGRLLTLDNLIPDATGVLRKDPNVSPDRVEIVMKGTFTDLRAGTLVFNCP